MDMQESMGQESFAKLLVTLWAIWGARRKAVHEEEFQSPLSTLAFINKFLGDLALLPTKNRKADIPVVRGNKANWVAPTRGFSKINVDAAVSRHQDRGAVAAFCRNDDGAYIGSSVLIIRDLIDPETLEALASAEGLSLASDLYLQRIQIATDCI